MKIQTDTRPLLTALGPGSIGGKPLANLLAQENSRKEGRAAALGKLPEFIAICYRHGSTLFDTATGACLPCLGDRSGLPVHLAYKDSYGILYPAECKVHGSTLFHVGCFKCADCFTARGEPRARAASVQHAGRVAAKAAGERQYMAQCATHGETRHSTARGLCLGCFNSLGKPRAGAWHRGPA